MNLEKCETIVIIITIIIFWRYWHGRKIKHCHVLTLMSPQIFVTSCKLLYYFSVKKNWTIWIFKKLHKILRNGGVIIIIKLIVGFLWLPKILNSNIFFIRWWEWVVWSFPYHMHKLSWYCVHDIMLSQTRAKLIYVVHHVL